MREFFVSVSGRLSLWAALAVGLMVVGSASARARTLTLDFDIPAVNLGASISYAGGAAPLIGTGITITDVNGLAITGGDLSFTTGG
jgi:hypothetical protein